MKCDNVIFFPIYFFPVGKSTSGKQVENHSHCPGTGEGDSKIIILRWKVDNMFYSEFSITIIIVLSML